LAFSQSVFHCRVYTSIRIRRPWFEFGPGLIRLYQTVRVLPQKIKITKKIFVLIRSLHSERRVGTYRPPYRSSTRSSTKRSSWKKSSQRSKVTT